MTTYFIEREFHDAGAMSDEELREMARKSNEIIEAMAPEYEWVRSSICDNKVSSSCISLF
jgi:hypothetical protein